MEEEEEHNGIVRENEEKKEGEANSQYVNKTKDRDRDNEEKKKPIDIKLLRKNITAKANITVHTSAHKQQIEATEEKQIPPKKNYACDKCKSCDEYEKANPKELACRNCGCDLIWHIRDGEENDNEDEDEWVDDEDDDSFEE